LLAFFALKQGFGSARGERVFGKENLKFLKENRELLMIFLCQFLEKKLLKNS
jgi:hypothetical protein